jgi:tetratricopeptide (TPR) repeat protein
MTAAGLPARSILALILLVTALTYRGAAGHGFVLDDHHTVADNPSVRSFAFLDRWFTSSHASSGIQEYRSYRPVLVAGYAVDYALWGDGPRGFHVTNVLIHLVVVILVYLLARRLWADEVAALCAAGVVALHPINAEVVNYVSARSSSLMTLFALAAVWAHDAAARGGSRHWRLPAYAAGLAAMGSKEGAMVLPALIVVWDRLRAGDAEAWRATLVRSLPWWALAAAFLAARTLVMGGGGAPAVTGSEATPAQALLFAIKIALASLGHWLWPSGLAVDHAWPITIGAREGALLVAGGVAAVAGTAVAARVDRRFGWCLMWFWIGIAPMGVLPFVSRLTLYQDHRVYLGGIALAWAAGLVAARALRTSEAARPAWAVAVVALLAVVAAAVAADVRRTAVWVDSAHLWDDVLAKYPDSILAHDSKGLLLLEAGKLEEARGSFEQALRLVPGFSQAHSNLGIVFARLGEWERAAAAFEVALKINPRYGAAALHLGKVYEHMGRADRALDLYERLARDEPTMAAAWARSGVVLEDQGRLEEAQERYRRWLALDPSDDQARLALGGVLLRLARWEEAGSMFADLTARQPASYPARFRLGESLEGLGRLDEALAAYRAAAALKPRDPDPHVRVALIHAKRGRWRESASEYDAALARDPDHFESHMNRALVAERLGDAPRAVSHYRAFVATSPADPVYDGPRAQARGAIARLQGGTLPRKAVDAPRGAGRG